MEHPQTVLLNKVLQANISLGNAHANKSEQSKIVRLWMDLQQSINVLFDSKTASGKYVYSMNWPSIYMQCFNSQFRASFLFCFFKIFL